MDEMEGIISLQRSMDMEYFDEYGQSVSIEIRQGQTQGVLEIFQLPWPRRGAKMRGQWALHMGSECGGPRRCGKSNLEIGGSDWEFLAK